ncbi:MAG TPA: ribbon-helix-helix protein, CopG family [Candidatus Obscuribacterales bacterium]
MATSFRLPPEDMSKLEQLAKSMGKSKAKVVRQAIEKLYDEQMSRSKHSVLDRLLDGDFHPQPMDLGNLSGDEARQRQVIRDRLKKKHRG